MGKSVFLKNVVGLMQPDKGSIKIDGKDVVGLPQKELTKVQSKFGMLFQGGALFDSMTVGENVAFGLKRHLLGIYGWKQRVYLLKNPIRCLCLLCSESPRRQLHSFPSFLANQSDRRR